MKNETLLQRIERYRRGVWSKHPGRDYMVSRSRHVAKLLGNPLCSSIDPAAAAATLATTGMRGATINRYGSILAKMGVQLSYRSEAQSGFSILSQVDLNLLDFRVREDRDEACQALYGLLRDSGCRGLAEWRRFDWYGVDWETGTFELESFKGAQKVRQVPMTEVSRRALSWLYHHSEEIISDSRWRQFWSRIRLDAHNVPYDLRHTYCTRLIDAGVPVTTVSRIMGHANLDQTMAYVHTTPTAIKSAAEALRNHEVRRSAPGSPGREGST